ncbi:NADPH:adrenodoxin oxidoreductase, mitochondrial-like isoform X2 [Apium graveolens]|uniref:NADPH:adrenodoxin oxidoreductase, mitochondrial-like isoform X2 n=1 Tax=Apium graveolens TaxID=4045 RepID=UPI003D7B0BB6
MSNLSNPAPVDSILIIEKMLKAHHNAEVDIVDRLPTPLGLVRSGVAPDHPETKIVTNQFSRVAHSDQFSYIGNVTLGSSIYLSELRDLYDVVVVAYGAESDRAFGIPGEISQGYTLPENLYGGTMGILIAAIWLQI